VTLAVCSLFNNKKNLLVSQLSALCWLHMTMPRVFRWVAMGGSSGAEIESNENLWKMRMRQKKEAGMRGIRIYITTSVICSIWLIESNFRPACSQHTPTPKYKTTRRRGAEKPEDKQAKKHQNFRTFTRRLFYVLVYVAAAAVL
jgi:hypothetical protein